MQITRAGEYAVLAATHLARQGPGRAVMIEEICETEKIPRSFLAKILQALCRAGLVRSQRGVHGGFRLAHPPSKISVLRLIEAIEGPIALQRCLDETESCRRADACTLADIFGEAQQRLTEVFAKTTVSDLLRSKKEVLRRVQSLGSSRPNGTKAPRLAAPPLVPLQT
ncbi:MAG: Rrf2 family transcriptional regulator [Verrucomicrobiae bacterium]|nr:Rrf2 family transcriptional regulator [Verrucomicrobiae bacterium]